MPEYLSPGVFVEEVARGAKPIAAVSTSTAGLVGVTRRGPATPELVTSYADFARRFGGPLPLPDDATRVAWNTRGHWWHAAESVKAFFDEGGARMYFQRVIPSAAVRSQAGLGGALYATLTADIRPTSTEVRLRHTVGVTTGQLRIVRADGTSLGTVTVSAVDYANRRLTLNAPAGFQAERDGAFAVIRPLATGANALDVLQIRAASPGAWGDELAVQVLPSAETTLELTATPASGAPVSTRTAAAAAAAANSITVAPVAGLDATTAVPFVIRANAGAPMRVTQVAASGANVALTLATALTAPIANNSPITVVRPASAAADIWVRNAGRLYPEAVLQLETPAGAELRTVVSIAGPQVTLDQAPANAPQEGDRARILEAQVNVRYRPQDGPEQTESFPGLRLTNTPDPTSMIANVNLNSRFVRLAAGGNYDGTDVQAFPASDTSWAPLTGGDDRFDSLDTTDFSGVNLGPGQRTGVQALEEIDAVAICAVPGIYAGDVQRELMIHCETLGDRFAVLDPPAGASVEVVERFRGPIESKFAALYYPWVQIRDPRPGGADGLTVPPSAFIAGVYARTDVARGVHKAPANEPLRSISGFEQTITKREQDILNPQNINVLRTFRGRGNLVWGARVLTDDTASRYVPVRRLILMIKESIDEATQWAVFEPNDEPLWARIRQSVNGFLTSQWRLGALQGVTAAQAFYVVCDRTTMSQAEIDNGLLICEIGIAPVKPAEFVVFRIQQTAGEPANA